MPSPTTGEPSRPVTLASLSTERPAGPTVMQQAHKNGLRRAVALIKNRLKVPGMAESDFQQALVAYLSAWQATYKQGVDESPSTVDRTILDIRRDTIAQILGEIGRAPVTARTVPPSAHGTRGAGDRPPDGLPPADF